MKRSRSAPALAAATPDLRRPAEGAHRDGVERVGDRDALEAEAAAQLAGRDLRARRRPGSGEKRRVDRGAEHHQVAAGGDEGAVGSLVDRRAASACERPIRCTAKSVFSGAAPRPGKCLAVAATPPSCSPSAKGTAVAATCSRGRAEAAFGLGDRAARPGDVEHRREVDVDAELAQVRRRAPALLAAEGGAARAHLRRRGRRGAAEPLHQPALLVDHHQQRVAQAGGRRIACRRAIRRRPAARLGRLSAKRTTPATPPVADRRLHGRRRRRCRSKPATIRSPARRGSDSVLAALGARPAASRRAPRRRRRPPTARPASDAQRQPLACALSLAPSARSLASPGVRAGFLALRSIPPDPSGKDRMPSLITFDEALALRAS